MYTHLNRTLAEGNGLVPKLCLSWIICHPPRSEQPNVGLDLTIPRSRVSCPSNRVVPTLEDAIKQSDAHASVESHKSDGYRHSGVGTYHKCYGHKPCDFPKWRTIYQNLPTKQTTVFPWFTSRLPSQKIQRRLEPGKTAFVFICEMELVSEAR